MTIVALDIGSKRVGVALSPSDPPIPVPVGVWARSEAESLLLSLIAERKVTTLVVGLALDINGNETEQSLKTRNFCKRIQKRANAIAIVFVDEYLTSEEAKGGASSLKHLDALAACEILKNYFAGISSR